MDRPTKYQVSLRGASAKEITRDALLEKVSRERELRNYTRRATAAATVIQKVWRAHKQTQTVCRQIQQDWEKMMDEHDLPLNRTWISTSLLRPFLLFVTFLSVRSQKIQPSELRCMQRCFKVLLESINSSDPEKNFCSLATSTQGDRKIWRYQSRKLVSFCLFVLGEYDLFTSSAHHSLVTSLAMRLSVVLTDLKAWRCINVDDHLDGDMEVEDLIHFMGSEEGRLYMNINQYIYKLHAPFSAQLNVPRHTDERLVITASAITLALRPLHIAKLTDSGSLDMLYSVEQFCVFILTIPRLAHRLPPVLLPALCHKTVLSLCFKTLLVSVDIQRENSKQYF